MQTCSVSRISLCIETFPVVKEKVNLELIVRREVSPDTDRAMKGSCSVGIL